MRARSRSSVSSDMPCTFCIMMRQSSRGISGSPKGTLGRVSDSGGIRGIAVVVVVGGFVVFGV